jgi:hypothetical protein
LAIINGIQALSVYGTPQLLDSSLAIAAPDRPAVRIVPLAGTAGPLLNSAQQELYAQAREYLLEGLVGASLGVFVASIGFFKSESYLRRPLARKIMLAVTVLLAVIGAALYSGLASNVETLSGASTRFSSVVEQMSQARQTARVPDIPEHGYPSMPGTLPARAQASPVPGRTPGDPTTLPPLPD